MILHRARLSTKTYGDGGGQFGQPPAGYSRLMGVQRFAFGHSEMMHLVVAALHHDAHKSERTDFLHLCRVASGDRQFHSIRQCRCPHRPTIQSINLASMIRRHTLDRRERAIAASHLDEQPALNWLLSCDRPHRHFVHVDQMLA